ncbi:MAG: AAA family ATPase [Bacteroidales bacterium]|nr:AAA family ATPase [Bacteroidales bacterium]
MGAFVEFRKKLQDVVTRRVPLVWIDCFDYKFLKKELDYVFQNDDSLLDEDERYKVLVWDAFCGQRQFNTGYADGGIYKTDDKDVLEILESFETNYEVLILKDIDSVLEYDENKRTRISAFLQNFCYRHQKWSCNDERRKIIIMQSSACTNLYPKIDKLLYKLELPLPDKDDIEQELCLDSGVYLNESREECKKLSAKYFKSDTGYLYVKSIVADKESYKKEMVAAFLGMNIYNIRHILTTIMEKNGCIKSMISSEDKDQKVVNLIKEEKKQIVKRSGLLDIIDVASEQKNSVGNVAGLMNYMAKQQAIIDNIAHYPPRMPKPKGILLVGAPGCGKSESAKAIAATLDKPLLRLDIGRLMGQYVGQSEHNLADAIAVAEAAAPCVLWIDEIEKAFAGFDNSGGDNDITVTRMIGSFLTWMQEHKSLVYLVATANNLDNLRPEFLRKGRWDEIFYLSYPDKDGAKDILKKCISKYGLEMPEDKMIDECAEAMAQIPLSGAEIDAIVVEAFQKGWKPNTENIGLNMTEVKDIVSTKKTQKESSKDSLLNSKIERGLKEVKLSRPDIPDRELEKVKTVLTDLYKEKTLEEIEKEYEAKGFISASKLQK